MTLAELGLSLKTARETKGLSLDDIAEKIKVSVRILRLIEDGSTHGLPHAVYSRGFILSYASILEYDKELLRAHLDELFPSEDMEEVRPMPSPIASRGYSSGIGKRIFVLLLLFAFLGGLIWGGWFVFSTYGDTITDWVKRPFSAISDPLPQTEPTSTPQAATRAEAPTQPQAAPEALSTAPLVVPVAPAAPVAGQQTVTTTASVGHQVVINAKSRCWIRFQVDEGAGSELTVKPGDSHTIAYKTRLKVTLGNPSGVELLVDGQAYAGELRSNRPITIEFP